jgi:hypothetical protein
MPPLIWQRQPGEAPADFTAFIAYLRLKGRRSHRLAATQTGRPLGAIRRLSAKFNWPARVAAFEARLADASQAALNLHVRATSARTAADFERLRFDEFLLARRVIDESRRWLQLASDPRRRDISFGQVCRLIECAFKLARLAAGMPTGDEPRGRPRREDAPGYWTGPSAEEALHKIYGSPESKPPVASAAVDSGAPLSGSSVSAVVASPPPANAPPASVPAAAVNLSVPVMVEPPATSNYVRRDA